jgi:hypothetical protein
MGIYSRKNSSMLKTTFLVIILTLQVISSKNMKTNTKKSDATRSESVVSHCNKKFRERVLKVESKLSKIKAHKGPSELNQHKLNFKNFIMDRSVKKEDTVTPNKHNFSSFLSLKNKKYFPSADHPGNFLVRDYVKNINDIPVDGSAKKTWSSTYWAMRNAMLAVRYDRTSRNTIGEWDAYSESFDYKYTYSESVSMFDQPDEYLRMMARGQNKQEYIDEVMSPAEKWDICFDDTSFTFTNWMRWKSDQHTQDGDIPSWYGICHGWAPASYYFNAPTKPVTLLCADGKTEVTFLPDDIKAYASMFLAEADYKTRFVGSACPYDDPDDIEADPSTGLYTDTRCSALDPGAFVIVLGNEIGINQKNFVFDPEPDGEIWNQPCESYSITWYNLKDKYQYGDIYDNMMTIDDLYSSTNWFLSFVYDQAPSDAYYVVGAYIDVTYGVETEAVKATYTLPDETLTGEYLAAIYLDKNYNIVGGRWKYNTHPNFAWKVDESVTPKGINDDYVKSFSGTSEELRNIASYAIESANNGQPLFKVVEYLVDESSR